jgi:hypothetical protein
VQLAVGHQVVGHVFLPKSNTFRIFLSLCETYRKGLPLKNSQYLEALRIISFIEIIEKIYLQYYRHSDERSFFYCFQFDLNFYYINFLF